MLTAIAMAMIVAALSAPINWAAIIWMFIAALWVVCARSNQLTAEDWKQAYDWRSRENTQLLERVDALRKQNSDYAEMYQTAAQDLDNAVQKVVQLTTALEAKNTRNRTSRKKKEDYTEQDITRIKNEMKSAGLVPEKEE